MNVLKLSKLLIEHRGEYGVREFAKRVGVSAATLSRVERGMLPDLETFTKLCSYLKLDPAEILEIVPDSTLHANGKQAPSASAIPAVHFRAEAQMTMDAAKDFAELIIAAQAFALSRG